MKTCLVWIHKEKMNSKYTSLTRVLKPCNLASDDRGNDETTTKKNLLKHEFSRTATITGLDAQILAEEVRKRRGTVYMHAEKVLYIN